MARTDLPKLRGATPTLFNTTASLFGLVAGGAAFAAVTWFGAATAATTIGLGLTAAAVPVAITAAVGAAAALLGGFVGKRRMVQEFATGVAVNPPSLLNKGLVNGLFLGAAAALAITAAPLLGITALPGFLTGTVGLAAVAAAPAALGSLFVAGTQARIYQMAAQQADVMQIQRQADAAKAKGLENVMAKAVTTPTVTKDDAALLEARLSQGRAGAGQSFAERITAAREVANQQLAK